MGEYAKCKREMYEGKTRELWWSVRGLEGNVRVLSWEYKQLV